ncbi:MAG: DUF58 domain-containing protein [Planctomycetota bacterium]
MLDSRQTVDPVFFSKLESLELRARCVVEGFLQGLHRSPFVGYSVEFASHREYVPGDDLRHVNWKLYARQKRLYVKEYDAETNMNLYVLLDVSGSMECASEGLSKLQYASTLAASLAHLALKQRDAVGITLFADSVLAHLPPSSKGHQLDSILNAIASTTARPPSRANRSLHAAAELAQHRGLVVIISDLFDDVEALMEGIEHLRFRRHEVVLFHVLDPLERDLAIDGSVRFRDLESGEVVTARVEAIRDDYLRDMKTWRDSLETRCRDRLVDRVELSSGDPLDRALVDYLVRRSQA